MIDLKEHIDSCEAGMITAIKEALKAQGGGDRERAGEFYSDARFISMERTLLIIAAAMTEAMDRNFRQYK